MKWTQELQSCSEKEKIVGFALQIRVAESNKKCVTETTREEEMQASFWTESPFFSEQIDFKKENMMIRINREGKVLYLLFEV